VATYSCTVDRSSAAKNNPKLSLNSRRRFSVQLCLLLPSPVGCETKAVASSYSLLVDAACMDYELLPCRRSIAVADSSAAVHRSILSLQLVTETLVGHPTTETLGQAKGLLLLLLRYSSAGDTSRLFRTAGATDAADAG
jgi:hypothetical protein